MYYSSGVAPNVNVSRGATFQNALLGKKRENLYINEKWQSQKNSSMHFDLYTFGKMQLFRMCIIHKKEFLFYCLIFFSFY